MWLAVAMVARLSFISPLPFARGAEFSNQNCAVVSLHSFIRKKGRAKTVLFIIIINIMTLMASLYSVRFGSVLSII